MVLVLALCFSSSVLASDFDLRPALESPSLDSIYTVGDKGYGPVAGARTAGAPPSQSLAVDELEAVSLIVTFDKSFDVRALEAEVGGKIIHRYSKIFNGASLILAGDKVEKVSSLKGITGVYLDELRQLDTDVSPGFIGATRVWDDLGGQGSAGEGITVGILDSGIWPEHPSYADPDPFGNGFAPPPVVPGSNGFASGVARSTCDFGNTAWNVNDAPFTCNNKLIAAYEFLDTYKAVVGLLPTEFDSARDDNGHGTHTSSTAAGNGGVSASIFGIPRGTISGIAPRAHIIMYRVCGDEGCFTSDSAAAVEQAILDEADAINFSIGGGSDPYSDIVSLAFLSAYENGVFVAASAGNSGPDSDTVAHRGPWTMTVGASTTDRHFLSDVTLDADNGDTLILSGASVTEGISTPRNVVLAADFGDPFCINPFAAGTVSGEIVVCQNGLITRAVKSYNVAAGGADGMLLYNPELQGLATDNHFIPSVHLENDAGQDLLDFMATHSGVTGTFTRGAATMVLGDKMAVFSSRGGPGQPLGISKPDITAPGIQILAGQTLLPATIGGGPPGQLFQSIRGTSMSSPHIAGSAALLKALHPTWTPGQIKSALMLTALTDGVFKEDGVTPADAFDYGSGRVDLNKAGNPGLTMDETAANYVALEGELWNANYPSLYVPVMPGEITVRRTVYNENSKKRIWKLTPMSPPDVKITVPRYIWVPAGRHVTFGIKVNAKAVPLGEVRHAMIELKQIKQRKNILRFPITIVRGEPAVTLDKSCDPASLFRGDTTDCTITITNTSFDDANVSLRDKLPWRLRLVKGSVVGAFKHRNGVRFDGTLFGATPPPVNVAVDPFASPAGYFPLRTFGSSIDIGATDESIANFNIPSFDYAGESYNQIGIVSNGYIVVGGGTGTDVDFINTDLPDPRVPNNVLAPFWTDLNPSAGGRVLINVLTDGSDTWTVVEWESVPNFGDGETNTTQVWIGTNSDANPGEDISFVYGPDVSDGDSGFLTVGAENKVGDSGGRVYFDGVGTPPTPSFPFGDYEVDVFSTPGAPGETHIITYSAWARKKKGPWTNCAKLTSDLFQGTNIACFSGEITH